LGLALVAFNPATGFTKNKMPVVKATVVDIHGKPVKGAYIFFYDGPDTKRAVDLVSPPTDEKGYCEVEVPPGTYWSLARLKADKSFDMGPLMIEDKFSGDPVEVELAPGDVFELEFEIMDLLETIRTKSKKRTDLNKVSGKVVNENGEAIGNVFVYANRHKSPVSMPDFFSAWTKEGGEYLIYLPKGRYNLGVSENFAPNQRYVGKQEITVDGNLEKVDVVGEGLTNKDVATSGKSD